MEILEEIANELRVNKDVLAKNSLKLFLQFDEQLKAGKVHEEDIMDDFMELDHLEARRDELLRALKKI